MFATRSPFLSRSVRSTVAATFVTLVAIPALSESSDLPPVQEGDSRPDSAARRETTHNELAPGADYDELVITGSARPRTRFDVIQGTNILSREELHVALMPTLGETLAELPGISSSYFGPGASRPIIRGLDGPRVRVLLNGLGSLDASVASPDHAVGTESMLTERVEVIRGAGTLLFGGSAIGGVVNVEDGRIPMQLPAQPVEADGRVAYGSAATERAAAVGLTAGVGPLAVRASGALAQSSDLAIPGYAVSAALAAEQPGIERGPFGLAESTQTKRQMGTLGAAFIDEKGMLGFAYGASHNIYGVPSEPGESVEIDLHQDRVEAKGNWQESFLLFEEASFAYGYSNYRHDEIEGAGEIASQVQSHAHEARIELVQEAAGDLVGSIGAQVVHRNFDVQGEEAFVPPSVMMNWGLFALEEYDLEPFHFEAGARFERESIESQQAAFARDFNAFSFALGASYGFAGDWIAGVNLSRTERPPSAEELLSQGAHLATGGFDLGDPSLSKEAGLTLEATVKRKRGRWTGGMNLYWSGFTNFIYQANGEYCDASEDPQGNPICIPNPAAGELQLRQFVQGDVNFWGGEVNVAFDFFESDPYTGTVDLAFDWVRADLGGGQSGTIPRIPPHRLKVGVEAHGRYADLRGEVWWVGAQERVATGELPTDSYVMLNLIFTAHPFPDQSNVTLVAQATNLLDEEARVHSSYLKDKLPLAGREARLTFAVSF